RAELLRRLLRIHRGRGGWHIKPFRGLVVSRSCSRRTEPLRGLFVVRRGRRRQVDLFGGFVVCPGAGGGRRAEPFSGPFLVHRRRIRRICRGYLHRGLIKTTRIAAHSISRAELLRRLLRIHCGRGGWHIKPFRGLVVSRSCSRRTEPFRGLFVVRRARRR